MTDRLEWLFYRYGWDTRCRNLCPARVLRRALPTTIPTDRPVVLDVGSGRRGLSAFLRDVPVVGSDLEPVSNGTGTTHAAFVQSTVTALPFCDRAFPAVSCIDVLEHLPPPQRLEAIRECVRVAAHAVVFAFPDGRDARRCDQAFQRACAQRARPVPAWVAEHLRHDLPTAQAVAEAIRDVAAASGRMARITSSACEPLAIARLVRAAAARSTALYVLANVLFGLGTPIVQWWSPARGYRAVLLAVFSSASDS